MTQTTVLLVDDDPVFSQFTQDLLTGEGMKVISACNRAEALERIERYRPSCAIIEIFLSDGSGIDLIRPMREAGPNVPIIMVSGKKDVDEVVRAMKEEANDFLGKPCRAEDLLVMVRDVLESAKAKAEMESLRSEARADEEYRLLFSLSDRMSEVQAIVDQVANTDITVLITGESGTGKELVAKALHKASDRAGEPFIKVNCAALPRQLLESELFGFEKGAFTGAYRRKCGRFEMAENGTIFLDEISEMHPDLQSKLLHVLQEKQFCKIGGEREVKVDCRVLTATNKKLEELVDAGRFRRDLFYRVNVVNIVVPPLRERKDDIPLLVDYFLKRYNEMYDGDALQVSPALMDMFVRHSWPGNVRELENNIKRLVILGNEKHLIEDLSRVRGNGAHSRIPGEAVPGLGTQTSGQQVPAVSPNEGDSGAFLLHDKQTLREVVRIAQRKAEKNLIEKALTETHWNRVKAAQILEISYKALLYKIKECGLTP